jgi:hypothetical protein
MYLVVSIDLSDSTQSIHCLSRNKDVALDVYNILADYISRTPELRGRRVELINIPEGYASLSGQRLFSTLNHLTPSNQYRGHQ